MRQWTLEEKYKRIEDPEALRPLHEAQRSSPYQLSYHVQPVCGLLNDPNGFFRDARGWHLFYQWCPWGAVHGLKHWYRVFSADLVHWRNEGLCLAPDREYDNRGVYSGSALVKDGETFLYYAGNHRDEHWVRTPYTCLARLMPNGTAVKLDEPLFGANSMYTDHQRDPKVEYNAEKGLYYLFLGAQNLQHKGRIIVYASERPDGGWRYLGELGVPGYEDFGEMWECPSIEHISGVDALIFCPQRIRLPGRGDAENHCGYILGSMNYDTLTFEPSGVFTPLDFGFDFYAAACAANADEAVMIAWMGLPGARYPSDAEDWQGALTLPRRLSVRGNHLLQQPVVGLTALRGAETNDRSGELPRASELELECGGGDMALRLFCRRDGTGGVLLQYDASSGVLTADRSAMTLRVQPEQGEMRAVSLCGGLRALRVYVDASAIEVFVNEGEAVGTLRVFPTDSERFYALLGDATPRLWRLDAAVENCFIL